MPDDTTGMRDASESFRKARDMRDDDHDHDLQGDVTRETLYQMAPRYTGNPEILRIEREELEGEGDWPVRPIEEHPDYRSLQDVREIESPRQLRELIAQEVAKESPDKAWIGRANQRIDELESYGS